MLAVTSFDLVILDLVLPGMDGLKILSKIKRQFPNTRIIASTTYSTVESALHARKLGVEDHTKVDFHLTVLKEVNLIKHDNNKKYSLSSAGERIVDCFSVLANCVTM